MSAAKVRPPDDDLFAPDDFPEEPKSAKRLIAEQSVLAFARPAIERKRRPFRSSPKSIALSLAESSERARTADWQGAHGRHLVGLYAQLHEGVYGFAPSELDAPGWAFASAAATRMVDRQFGADFERAVEFMRWVWRREEERERWRRANAREGGRIGWRLQFGAAALVDDYRVDQARRHT
jgi:hypothetical protein